MSAGLYSITTRATGTVLTAAIYNADHQNHTTNQTPQMTGAYSDNVGQMQSAVSPGGVGSEVLAGSLAGEIERLRYQIQQAHGCAQWYGTTTVSPAQITSNQNDYTPAGLTQASMLRINSDARRSLTGILAPTTDRRPLTLVNVGTFPILIKAEDAGSAAANRFSFGHTLSGGHTMKIAYDITSARWRCVAKEEPAGTLKDFAGGTVPEGYIARDGSNILRAGTFAALFNEVGTTWGVGDGSTTFGVGDDRRRSSIGSGGVGTGTIGNAVGNTGGEEGHSLTGGESGPHAHGTGAGDRFVTLTAGGDGGQVAASAGGDALQGSSGSAASTTASSGSGTAHNTYHPAYVVTKIIKY